MPKDKANSTAHTIDELEMLRQKNMQDRHELNRKEKKLKAKQDKERLKQQQAAEVLEIKRGKVEEDGIKVEKKLFEQKLSRDKSEYGDNPQKWEIKKVFDDIGKLFPPQKTADDVFASIYKALSEQLGEFRKELLIEAEGKNPDAAEATARMLERAVKAVLNTQIDLKQKQQAIVEFRDHARESNYSPKAKVAMCSLAVGLVILALGVLTFVAIGLL